MKLNMSAAGLPAAAFLLLATSALAQAPQQQERTPSKDTKDTQAAPLETGIAHPEELNDVITTAPAAPQHYQKPSPAVPLEPKEPEVTERFNYAPAPTLHERTEAPPLLAHEAPVERAALPPTELVHEYTPADDPDGGIVGEVPSAPNEIPMGSLLHVRLLHEVSTETTASGELFQGQLAQPITRRGVVLLPAGSLISGRVTGLHGGRRLSGAATIQLVPEFLTLPDGTRFALNAQVVDVPHMRGTHVTDEGTIQGNDHVKGTAAVLGLSAGSGAAAGGLLGGPPGAVIGAVAGAGVATYIWLRHDTQQTLNRGTEVVFSLGAPMKLDAVRSEEAALGGAGR